MCIQGRNWLPHIPPRRAAEDPIVVSERRAGAKDELTASGLEPEPEPGPAGCERPETSTICLDFWRLFIYTR
ncbi:unnamed protein product [Ranitomeya imitator]|uniref:Uncharacterized protein n=1 Tax=Ranitomeya imitator TaxID=111125 RepID=A0ABN9MLD5_9NEOB|nr:unnamed protein product [Ranitomeya imitator]